MDTELIYVLTITGPDAEDGVQETVPLRNRTTAYNVYKRLAYRNHITLVEPDGNTLDSEVQPDPWEARALA